MLWIARPEIRQTPDAAALAQRELRAMGPVSTKEIEMALIFLGLLAWDVYLATQWPDGFHVGVGTLLLAVNVVLLSSYTLGCHSIRHVVGGRKDEISKNGLRQTCYNCSTALNYKHQLFAWMSLFSVAFSDVYVRLLSMGYLTDARLF